MGVSFGLIAFQVAGRATRDALFLSHFSVTDLPRVVAAAALVSIVLALAASRLLERWGPGRFVPRLLAASTLLLLLEFALLRVTPRAGAVAVFMHFNAIGALLVSAFWSLINERFDVRTAKRHIGRIGAAATAGGVAGGVLAERVAAMASLGAMVPVLAAVHLVCAILALRIGPIEPRPVSAAARSRNPLRALAASPYLRTLAIIVVLATVGEGLLDYVFKAAATDRFGSGDQLLRFFAAFYTVVNVGSIALQAALARPALERLGLARTTGLLPWTVAIGAAAALAVPGLISAMIAKAGEAIMRNSLYRSGYELLFTPIGAAEKRSVKSVLDVGGVRIGDVIAAGLVQLALIVLATRATTAMLGLAIVVAAAGIMLIFTVHAGYLATLERSLLSRAVQLDLDDVEDSTTRSMIEQTLSNLPVVVRPSGESGRASSPGPVERRGLGDPVLTRLAALRSKEAERVREALAGAPLQPELISQAIALLAWDEVTTDARDALNRIAPRHVGQLVDALLDPDSDFAVRRRIPAAIARAPSTRALEGLLAGLADPRFEVRFRCGRALVRLMTQEGAPPLEADRVYGAVLREVTLERGVFDGQRLLEKEDDDPLDLGEELQQRASRSLEHVFTMLSLVLPPRPLQVAFRGLLSGDAHIRGTALEYLETALPATVREKLWPLLDQQRSVR